MCGLKWEQQFMELTEEIRNKPHYWGDIFTFLLMVSTFPLNLAPGFIAPHDSSAEDNQGNSISTRTHMLGMMGWTDAEAGGRCWDDGWEPQRPSRSIMVASPSL